MRECTDQVQSWCNKSNWHLNSKNKLTKQIIMFFCLRWHKFILFDFIFVVVVIVENINLSIKPCSFILVMWFGFKLFLGFIDEVNRRIGSHDHHHSHYSKSYVIFFLDCDRHEFFKIVFFFISIVSFVQLCFFWLCHHNCICCLSLSAA